MLKKTRKETGARQSAAVRVAAIVAILALVSSMIGCTSYVDIPLDEIYSQADRDIDRVVLTTSIEGVVKKSGEEVLFDRERGLIDAREHLVSGVTVTGETTAVKLADLKSVLLINGGLEGNSTEEIPAGKFARRASIKRWKTHQNRSVKSLDKITLNSTGGWFNPETGLVSGLSRGGLRIDVDPATVILQERKFSPGKTALLVTGVAAAVAGVVLIKMAIDLSNWDGFGGSGNRY